MLTYCRGSDLASLADHFLGELENNPPRNILAPERIVVQNHGMARWLSLYVAEKEGVAANLKFEFPAERIWSMIRVLKPGIPQKLPSDRGPMTWALMHLLEQAEGRSELDVLSDYMEESDPLKRDVRRWKLAGRISDVFDQYLTYRPEMVLAWEKNKLVTKQAAERWQSVLWRKLVKHWKQTGADGRVDHRATLQEDLAKALKSQKIETSKLPERVTVFGVSAMPPKYIELLVKLSRLVDVYFYLMDGADQPDNPLTSSLGKAATEYRGLLESYMEEEAGLNISRVNIEPSGESTDTLFGCFRNGLLGAEVDQVPIDDSIIINSCHSSRREVEVLYDHLLAMLESNEELQPSDILVLAPDFETYAPEIEAVFGAVEEGLPEISWHLAEKASGRPYPVHDSFIRLMELVESRFKVTDILDLIDSRPIRDRFELSEANLNTLEHWIADNRIRWGIDGAFKTSMQLPGSDTFSWRSGLDRILAGYMMEAEGDELFQGIHPYGEIDRSDAAILAGRFSSLMESLFESYEECTKVRSVPGWTEVLQGWLGRFFPDNDDYFYQLRTLRDAISDLADDAEFSAYRHKIPFRIVRSALSDLLATKSTGGGRSGKGVAFGSLVAMRNISAKVICLLGMNDGDFPRSAMQANFDLIQSSQQPGDRIRSQEDRLLFLEALSAAKEKLYISYVGQSNRQDTDLPPSVVVREWCDYLSRSFDIPQEKLFRKQRLQPFSPAYFTEGSANGFFSYSTQNCRIAKTLLSSDGREPEFIEEELQEADASYRNLSLGELIRFFQHPARYLLRNRLGIYLEAENVVDEDREDFIPDSLQGYKLGQELLERYLKGEDETAFKPVADAINLLPEGWPGEQFFESKACQVRDFGNKLQDILKQSRYNPIEVALSIGEFHIAGRLDSIYETEQLLFRFGHMRAKDLIELWIKHLAFQEVKPPSHSGYSSLYARGSNGSEPVAVCRLSPPENHRRIFQNLLEVYWSGLQKNTFFFPGISFEYARLSIAEEKEEEAAIRGAAGRWKNDFVNYAMEGDDIYNSLLMGGRSPLGHKEFTSISKSIWKPFFDQVEEGGS